MALQAMTNDQNMHKPDFARYSPLFDAVQMQEVFVDSKTFVDCTPLSSWEHLEALYAVESQQPGFDLKAFVLRHFELPHVYASDFIADSQEKVETHIERLWPYLTRQPGGDHGSLIGLPFPYIVPGGRFGEIYYWDSYFTQRGLAIAGHWEMVENMIRNFASLIDRFGFIPNGNRSYYLGRSQPPFFSLMIELLAQEKGQQQWVHYLPMLQKEYAWWMRGEEEVSRDNPLLYQVARMPDGSLLNRYWDELDLPRPEAYREDRELAIAANGNSENIYRHLRAAAASGWDFSSRWFTKADDFASIDCFHILPVDLNCLLYHVESSLAHASRLANREEEAEKFLQKADQRKKAIDRYCWNEEEGFYFDYHVINARHTYRFTAAASFCLYFGLASPTQASRVADKIAQDFLKEGGVLTTIIHSGQQWDAPNGWAPLQWMTIHGLEKYGFHQLAAEVAHRWIRLNREVFKRSGKMMEKYNVENTSLDAGGGEYAGQDGFGWTNGVFLDLVQRYG